MSQHEVTISSSGYGGDDYLDLGCSCGQSIVIPGGLTFPQLTIEVGNFVRDHTEEEIVHRYVIRTISQWRRSAACSCGWALEFPVDCDDDELAAYIDMISNHLKPAQPTGVDKTLLEARDRNGFLCQHTTILIENLSAKEDTMMVSCPCGYKEDVEMDGPISEEKAALLNANHIAFWEQHGG